MARYEQGDRFAHDGTCCPFCGSERVREADSYGWDRIDPGDLGSFRALFHDFRCAGCGRWWRNVYPYAFSVALEDAGGGYPVYLDDEMLGAVAGGQAFPESIYDPDWAPGRI